MIETGLKMKEEEVIYGVWFIEYYSKQNSACDSTLFIPQEPIYLIKESRDISIWCHLWTPSTSITGPSQVARWSCLDWWTPLPTSSYEFEPSAHDSTFELFWENLDGCSFGARACVNYMNKEGRS